MQKSFYRIVYYGGLGREKNHLDQKDVEYLCAQGIKYGCAFAPIHDLSLPIITTAQTPLGLMHFEFYQWETVMIPMHLNVEEQHADLAPHIQLMLNLLREVYSNGMRTETMIEMSVDEPLETQLIPQIIYEPLDTDLIPRVIYKLRDLGVRFSEFLSPGYGVEILSYFSAILEGKKTLLQSRRFGRILCLTPSRAFYMYFFKKDSNKSAIAISYSSIMQEWYVHYIAKNDEQRDVIRKQVDFEGEPWYRNFLRLIVEENGTSKK